MAKPTIESGLARKHLLENVAPNDDPLAVADEHARVQCVDFAHGGARVGQD